MLTEWLNDHRVLAVTGVVGGVFVSTPPMRLRFLGRIMVWPWLSGGQTRLILVFVLTPQPLEVLAITVDLSLIPIDLLLLLIISYFMPL